MVPLAADAARGVVPGAWQWVGIALVLATTRGAPGIVAVLSAPYRIVTVALARIVLAERLNVTQRVGGAVAITGAVLVATG